MPETDLVQSIRNCFVKNLMLQTTPDQSGDEFAALRVPAVSGSIQSTRRARRKHEKTFGVGSKLKWPRSAPKA